MKNIILLCSFLCFTTLHATCVHEFELYGVELDQHKTSLSLNVDVNGDGRFLPLEKVKNNLLSVRRYQVQLESVKHDVSDYDNRYIKYYRYQRMQEFLQEFKTRFEQNDYITEVVGKSLKGRDLTVVHPRKLDANKKLIVMFGRHHGDEGTANWIIEGFVEDFFSKPEVLEQYQLVLYPMVNPDGAENRVRYNTNRYDLNRVWGVTPNTSKDEVRAIHSHLDTLVIKNNLQPVITLDMHGSFDEDFIYRVGASTFGRAYHQMQQIFIDELGTRDEWQAGNFILSEGEAGMARIRLAKVHGWHTLTHETPRDIPLQNRRGRSLQSLKDQGIAALETIQALY